MVLDSICVLINDLLKHQSHSIAFLLCHLRQNDSRHVHQLELDQESTGYKHCISTLKEELDLKTSLIQKLMLKLQTQKTNQSEMKDELHSRSCGLELTKRMLNEFHKAINQAYPIHLNRNNE